MSGSHRRRRPATLLAGAALWAGLGADAAAQESAASDRAALEALYDATGGPGWTDGSNWKTAAPLGEWHGVTAAPGGRVVALSLRDNGLAGSIPAALGNLTSLESLDLGSNDLTGPIPAGLGNLAQLRWLSFSGNDLTGPIPGELGNLANVESLSLHSNRLTGPLPAWLGNLTNLRGLQLGRNDLTGPIPGELGSLANIESLALNSNGLTGPVPAWLGNLASLRRLSLHSNALTGPVPGELASLMNIETLDLSWNPLTGALPRRLTGLSQLTRLGIAATAACAPADEAFQAWLATLDFQGDICNRPPEPAGAIPAQALTQSGPAVGVSMEAHFTDPDDDPMSYAAASGRAGTVTAFAAGDIVWLVPGAAGPATVTVTASDPDGLSTAQAVEVTTIAAAGPQSDREVLESLYDATGGASWTNRASWKTRAPLGEWYGVTTDAADRVTGLDLPDNGLTGPVPATLGRLENLERLNLDSNALVGAIPSELGNLEHLERLSLFGNDLTGPAPAWLGNLTRLRWLDLAENALSGPIPDALGGLENLQLLFLAGNALTGPVPARLGSLALLRWLDLAGNALSGPVPGELGRLRNLEALSLRGNALSGPIPDALARLENLQQLDLTRNGLSGAVPAWLGDLTRLRGLELGVNALTGPIPNALGSLTDLERLDVSYNWGVTGPLPPGLRLPRLEALGIFVTRSCAPAAWRDWLATIEFNGRRCGRGADVTTIDAAVLYTPAAREAAGGTPAIEALIDLMVAETNEAYEASGVGHRLALVARSETPYTETGDSALDIRRLEDPSDGHLDEAHALRAGAGADVVHLIFEEGSVGGLANIGGPFGLTCRRCGGTTFAHELGHNMGLLHDRYQVHHHEAGVSPHPAYGYVNPRGLAGAARSSRWLTLMSYPAQCVAAHAGCAELLRFSNPRQRYNGDPLGVPFGEGSGVTGPADAAAVLNVTGPAVAAWRDRAPRANRPPVAVGTLPDRRLTPRGTLSVDVSLAFVDPDGDALAYTVSTSASQVVTVLAAGTKVTLTAVSEGTATVRVTATDPGGLSAAQAFAVTVSTVSGSFTDDPIQPGVTPVRAVHFTELRARIDALRSVAGLARFSWTDPVLRAGVTRVRRVHLLELRSALAEAYGATGRAAPRWTDAVPAAGSTPIRAAHVTELRAAVLALE